MTAFTSLALLNAKGKEITWQIGAVFIFQVLEPKVSSHSQHSLFQGRFHHHHHHYHQYVIDADQRRGHPARRRSRTAN